MLIIPAIDLKDGEVVRLYKGDYKQKTIYSKNPEEIAKKFEELGAKCVHIVDLDGAKDGKCLNYETIDKIRKSIKIPIELGGGIRDEKTVELYLDKLKINRIILGTAALNNPDFLQKMLNKYGSEKIMVGVDVKEDGYVMTSGWIEKSKFQYTEFIKKLENIGVKYIVVTDISKDGTLKGPNFEMYKTIKNFSEIKFIVSGGIKDRRNVEDAKKIDAYGCIIGKAYYEGKIDLKEAIKC